MIPWQERPLEVANLLNPAFAAIVIHEAVRNYVRAATIPMPVALSFLVPPIALHPSSRGRLPATTVAKMRPWLEDYPEVRIGFPGRVRALSDFVREGIVFAGQYRLISVSEDGGLVPSRKSACRVPATWQPGSDPYECWKATGFVARWCASTAAAPTLFALWGVKP